MYNYGIKRNKTAKEDTGEGEGEMCNQRNVVAKLNKEQLKEIAPLAKNTRVAKTAFKEAAYMLEDANRKLWERLRSMFQQSENWDGLMFDEDTGEIIN